MKNLKILILIFCCFLFAQDIALSQHKNQFGLSPVYSLVDGSSNLGFGLQYERFFDEHKAIETGLYYRSNTQLVPNSIVTDNTKIRENYLWIPILAKYYTKVVVFSAGATFQKFIGWNDISSSSTVSVTSYKINPEFTYGLIAKVSKPIDLNKNFIVEPGVSVNPLLNISHTFYNFGLSFKAKF